MAEIVIKDVRGGLNLDYDPANIQSNEALVATNIDPRYGGIRKLSGGDDVFSSLPTGVTPRTAVEVLFTKPSEKQVTLLYARDGSNNEQLYVRPHVVAGSWVDTWLELTEHEGDDGTPLVADTSTNTTTIIDSALASSVDDFYNGWIVVNLTRTGSSIVSDYVGSTKTLTLKWAIASQVATDTYVIMRFPVLNMLGEFLFAPKNQIVRFRARENRVEVYTGNDVIYPTKTDFILEYMNRSFFDDSGLDINAFWFSRNNLDALNGFNVAGTTLTAETDDPFPADTYVMVYTVLYDGFQEGPQFKGLTPFNGTSYSVSDIITVIADRLLRLVVSIPVQHLSADNQPLIEPENNTSLPIFDKRITKIQIYAATAIQQAGGGYAPSEAFRIVKDIKVDSTDWAGTGPYTQTVDLFGSDYTNNAGNTISARQGFDDLNVNANADFAAFVGQNLFIASVFIDERRDDFIIKTPVNSAQVNTPDVKPWGQYIDTSVYGLPRIIGVFESVGHLVVIGENRILRISSNADNTIVQETFVERGGVSPNGIVEAGGIIYISGLENIYSFATLGSFGFRGGLLRKLGDRESEKGTKGGILAEWIGFTASQRQSSVMGYDRRFNLIALAVSTTVYLYFIDLDAWFKYDGLEVGESVRWFYTGFDGELIAATTNRIKELFSSDPDVNNGISYKSGALQGPLRTNRLRPTRKNDDNITITLYDLEKSATVPRVKPTIFSPETVQTRKSKTASARFERLQIELTTASSANLTNEIESLEIEVEPLRKL